MNTEINRRKKYWLDFQDLTSPVNRLLMVNCSEGMPERPMLWWEKKEERIEWAYERYMRCMDQMSWLNDHSIPFLNVLTGTEIFAEAFGCDVFYPEDNNPAAKPLVFSVEEAVKLKTPRLEDTKIMNSFEMARRLRDRAGRDALLCFPDIQVPADIAALIWEKSDFMMALYDEPEAVRELSLKIRGLLFEFFDLWIREFGDETIAHWPEYYMEKGVTMSIDEIGCVNTDMYVDFFEEDVAAFAERYGQIGLHCCAFAKHQWQNLSRTPNLKLINLCISDDRDSLESLQAFEGVCCQLPMNTVSPDRLPGAERIHTGTYRYVGTKAEALRLVNEFYEKYPYLAK